MRKKPTLTVHDTDNHDLDFVPMAQFTMGGWNPDCNF